MLQRRGLYPAPPGSPPDIPGMEFAGEVVAVGRDVERFCGRRPGHGARRRRWAGRARARCTSALAMPVPDTLDMARRPAGSPRCSPPRTTRCSRQCALAPGRARPRARRRGRSRHRRRPARRARRSTRDRDSSQSGLPRRCRRDRDARRPHRGRRAGCVRRARPLRRRARAHRGPEHPVGPRRARRRWAHRGDRRRRRRRCRGQPADPDGEARSHPRLDAPCSPARGEGPIRAARRGAACSRSSGRRAVAAGPGGGHATR